MKQNSVNELIHFAAVRFSFGQRQAEIVPHAGNIKAHANEQNDCRRGHRVVADAAQHLNEPVRVVLYEHIRLARQKDAGQGRKWNTKLLGK